VTSMPSAPSAPSAPSVPSVSLHARTLHALLRNEYSKMRHLRIGLITALLLLGVCSITVLSALNSGLVNHRFDADGRGFTNGHGRTLSSGLERFCCDCGRGIEVPVLPVTVGASCPFPGGTTIARSTSGDRPGSGW